MPLCPLLNDHMAVRRLLCCSLLLAVPCLTTRPQDEENTADLQTDNVSQSHEKARIAELEEELRAAQQAAKDSEAHAAQLEIQLQLQQALQDNATVGFPLPCRFNVRDSRRPPTSQCVKFLNLFIACDQSLINTAIKVPGHVMIHDVGVITPGRPVRRSICSAEDVKESDDKSKKMKLLGNVEGGEGGIGEVYAKEEVLQEGSLPCKLSMEKYKTADGSDGLRFSSSCSEEVNDTCMTTGLRETCFNLTVGKNQTLRFFAVKELDAAETSAQLVGLYKGADGWEEGLSNAVPIGAQKKENAEQDDGDITEPKRSGATGRRLCIVLRGLTPMFAAAVSFL